MAVVKQAIAEDDAVVLLEHVGRWRRGTYGTAVSLVSDLALVEISEDTPPGRTLDMIEVPISALQPRVPDPSTGPGPKPRT